MVISEIKKQNVIDFLRLDDGQAQDKLLTAIMDAARQYIMDYTGLTEDELDEHEDFYVAYMVLVQDMYDDRSYYIDKSNVNRVVDSILFRHRTNFV